MKPTKTIDELKKLSHDLIRKDWDLKKKEQSFFNEVAEQYFYSKGNHYVYNEKNGNFLPVIAIVNDVITDATLEEITILQQSVIDDVVYVPIIKILDLRTGETYDCDMSDLKDISYSDLGNLLLAELD